MWALVAVLALAQRVGGGGTAPAPPPSAEEDDLVAQAFWQGTNLAFAFLDAGTAADPKTAAMVQTWSDRFLRRYDWEDRVVVDYGAASGLLGEWLLQTGKARHYVAVDIADRAVQAARVRLQGLGYHDGHRGRFESLQAPLELCTLSASVVVPSASLLNILLSRTRPTNNVYTPDSLRHSKQISSSLDCD